MALLIYDNGNLVKNPSDATFPLRGVNATYSSRAPQSSTQRQPLPQETKPVTHQEPAASARSTVVSSRLYEETGRKSDSLQDRRRLTALHVMAHRW